MDVMAIDNMLLLKFQGLKKRVGGLSVVFIVFMFFIWFLEAKFIALFILYGFLCGLYMKHDRFIFKHWAWDPKYYNMLKFE